MTHKVTFFNCDRWGDVAKSYLSGSEKLKTAGVEVAFGDSILCKDEIPTGDAANFDIAGVFMDSPVDATVIGALPELKFITTLSTGFDHIDLAAAAAHSIPVSSVPAYGENTVAEFTFALILALSRKVAEANRRVVETGGFSQEGLRGFDLEGKTLGVVGGGHIGMRVVKIAKGFGMQVLVFDVNQNETLARDAGFSYAPLDELLARSDITTLHVPYNAHTHHLLNRETISRMKRGSYLINTARGAVVETKAIVEAIAEGTLAGAGLDVLEEEGDLSDELKLLGGAQPKPEELATALANHYLMKHPRIIVTPHVAFNTSEAIARILDVTISNIRAFSHGAPENVVS